MAKVLSSWFSKPLRNIKLSFSEQAELDCCDVLVRVPLAVNAYPGLPELCKTVEAFFPHVFGCEVAELLPPAAAAMYAIS